MDTKNSCACPCHRMLGIFVILFGLNFLLKTLGIYGDNIANLVWPSLIVLAGLKITVKGMCKCCSDG